MLTRDPNSALMKLSKLGVVPVVRVQSAKLAETAVQTLIRSGFPTAEITMTVPGAVEIISDLAKKDFMVGAGTILDVKQAKATIDAGAYFVVSPCIVQGLAELCAEANVACVMGGMTPNEVIEAWNMGSHAVKVFPAQSAGGHNHLKALKAVFPSIPLVPTGGVSLSNIKGYLDAGAAFVGTGSDLVNESKLKEGRFEEMVELGKQYLAIAKDTRQGG